MANMAKVETVMIQSHFTLIERPRVFDLLFSKALLGMFVGLGICPSSLDKGEARLDVWKTQSLMHQS